MKMCAADMPATALGPIERVLAQARERGAPDAYAAVIEDRDGRWRHSLGSLSLDRRRRSILVAEHAEALVVAARLSVGGAMLLPASTAGAEAALAAAEIASARLTWCADPTVAAEMQGSQMVQISFRRPGLWRLLVGDRGGLEILAALAAALGRPAVVEQGPALSIGACTEEEIRHAWSALDVRPKWAGLDELVLGSPGEPEESGFAAQSWPVAALPSGRQVGRWSLGEGDSMTALKLVATVAAENKAVTWTLHSREADPVAVVEVADATQLADLAGNVVRVPAWLSLDLDRAGSPGAVLIAEIAAEAERRGMTLWIPNVTGRTLPFVLRLPGEIWVDGPSVPDQDSK